MSQCSEPKIYYNAINLKSKKPESRIKELLCSTMSDKTYEPSSHHCIVLLNQLINTTH